MTSTKVTLAGVLVMLLGFALDSSAARLLWFTNMGADASNTLAYLTVVLFAAGFLIAVAGLLRR